MINLFFIILSLVFIVRNCTAALNMTEEEAAVYKQFLSDQKRLYTDLFSDYDAGLSGIYTLYSSKFANQTGRVHPPATELVITMYMLKLVDVVEVEEKVTFLFDFISRWTDFRLSWDPLKYGGITHIYIPLEKVWIPEVIIADAHEVKYFQSDDAPATAWITYEGGVGYYTSTLTSVICSLDVYRFPLDSHDCGVVILFNTYYSSEYKIINGGTSIAKPLDEMGNGEWRVTHVGSAEVDSYMGRSDPLRDYSIIRFQAKFSRNPLFYVTLVMIPAYLINFLSLIAIFLNLDNIPEKINVGLTNIMAMTFILIILATDLPKTKNIPLIAIYVIVGLVIMMLALVIILMIPFMRKCEKKFSKIATNNEKPKLTRFGKFKNWLKIEFVLMFIFQIANLLNFLIIFM